MIRAFNGVVLLVIGCGLGFAAAQLALPSFPPDFESRCVFPGLSFMQSCEAETVEALAYFGVDQPGDMPPQEVSLAEIDSYIAQANPPSAKCCQAACYYANSVCNCEPVATNWAGSLFFGTENYAAVIRNYGERCQFKDLIGSCPDVPAEWVEKNPDMNICKQAEEKPEDENLDEEPLEEPTDFFAQSSQPAPADESDMDDDSVSSMLEDLID
ncbi:hypothetical protein BSKO_08913 [Bryopsis sp. KO-2023]|nr:hypothetical protein BSKO_08913 [Bryopsis sp. KO-2023]